MASRKVFMDQELLQESYLTKKDLKIDFVKMISGKKVIPLEIGAEMGKKHRFLLSIFRNISNEGLRCKNGQNNRYKRLMSTKRSIGHIYGFLEVYLQAKKEFTKCSTSLPMLVTGCGQSFNATVPNNSSFWNSYIAHADVGID